MKSVFFVIFFIKLNVFAVEVIRPSLVAEAKEEAYSKAEEFCRSANDLVFIKSSQVVDSYSKYTYESGRAYYKYTPIIIGSAFCKSTKSMITWTVSTDYTKSELKIKNVFTLISTIED